MGTTKKLFAVMLITVSMCGVLLAQTPPDDATNTETLDLQASNLVKKDNTDIVSILMLLPLILFIIATVNIRKTGIRGIKYDWQRWASDENVVKKIFWFIWLLVWTISKFFGWIAAGFLLFVWKNRKGLADGSIVSGGSSGGRSSSQKFICKHCGQEYNLLQDLIRNSCPKSPSKHHEAYSGNYSSQTSIRSRTS